MKTTPDFEQYLNECRQAAATREQNAQQLVVPVMRQLLADQHTTVSLLQRFYHGQEGVFLLESVEVAGRSCSDSAGGGEKWARYSFLGIDAHAFVEVHQNEIRIIECDDEQDEQDTVAAESGHKRPATRSYPHHGKPLECLRDLMSQYHVAQHAELPRFFGGLVGYFTYEMVSFFENIPHKLENEPFASFVIPRTLLILDNVKQVLTVCVLTFPNRSVAGHNAPGVAGRAALSVAGRTAPCQKSPETLYRQAVAELEDIVAELENPIAAKPPHVQWVAGRTAPSVAGRTAPNELSLMPVLSEREYRKRVEQIKQHINCGDIIQCVFSQPFVAEDAPAKSNHKTPGNAAIALYRALRFANPAPYMFFMHLSGNVLAGSSPETMVRLEGRTATLRPIAGTRKRGESSATGRFCPDSAEQRDREMADELLRDPKERAEHLMLVDLGRNDLGRVAKTGSVQVTDLMFIERHSHVMHLVSNVTAELEDGYDGFDLFRATFPAGTLTGAPKVRAMQIIAEYESTPRGPYGGAAGYIAFNGNMDFAITIRTARIKVAGRSCLDSAGDGRLTVQSGGGIVYDSDPELERLETVNKAMGIERALHVLTQVRQ
ncbi:MAG: anthranilate synthase component I family protein [Planctomycetaceae bacterium]|nr:anthranilate synthase component I family protein [Planctomycetaceae bacterium]